MPNVKRIEISGMIQMPNVKRIEISGMIPYHCGKESEVASDDEVLMMLGRFNMPSFNVQISYSFGGTRPNSHGGHTTWYWFSVRGEEAVSLNTFKHWVSLFERIGNITSARCHDIENNILEYVLMLD